jgi:two-component system sensor histidine kinase KdpD
MDRPAQNSTYKQLTGLTRFTEFKQILFINRTISMQASSDPHTEPVPIRLLVCLNEQPIAERVLRTAVQAAVAQRAELYALYVETPGASTRRSPEAAQWLKRTLALARDLGAEVEVQRSHRISDCILQFIQQRQIRRIFLGSSQRPGWKRVLVEDVIGRIKAKAGNVPIEVIE